MCAHFLSRANAQKILFGILLSGQTLLLVLHLRVHLPQTYHLSFPRPAPIWPCSSVGRATVICTGGREFGSNPVGAQRLFSLCGPISFQGLTPRSYYLEYLLEQFNLPYLNHYRRIPIITGPPKITATRK